MHLTDPSLRKIHDNPNQGDNKWVEGGGNVFEVSSHGPSFGRFLCWLFVLIGGLVFGIYMFDIYQNGSTPFSNEKSDDALLEESNVKFRSAIRKVIETTEGLEEKPSLMDKRVEPDGIRKDIHDPLQGVATRLGDRLDDEDPNMFYNPRRTKRYWASGDSRHDSVDDAIESLAAIYERTPDWINKHMGAGNNLQTIHRNLIEQQDVEATAAMKAAAEETMHGQLPMPDQKDADPADSLEKLPQVAAVSSSKVKDTIAAKGPAPARTKKRAPEKAEEKNKVKAVAATPPKKSIPAKAIAVQVKKQPSRPKKDVAKKSVKVALSAPVKKTVPVKTVSSKAKKVTSSPKNTEPSNTASLSAMQKQGIADKIKQNDKKRVLAFLNQYTTAYEQRDIDQFEKFFTQDATEMGKLFKSLLPTYNKTFKRVDALKYDIELKAFTSDKISKTIHLNGVFTAQYRLPDKEWNSRSGSIRMELLDSATGLLVRRLEYEMGR